MKGAGYAPFEKGDKYQRADQRILNLVNNFGTRNDVEYLRGVSHNLPFSSLCYLTIKHQSL